MMWLLGSLLMLDIKLRLEMMLQVRGASQGVSPWCLGIFFYFERPILVLPLPQRFLLTASNSSKISPLWSSNELTTSSLNHLIMICCLAFRYLSHAFPPILYCKLFKGREYSLYLCIPQLATECWTHNYLLYTMNNWLLVFNKEWIEMLVFER